MLPAWEEKIIIGKMCPKKACALQNSHYKNECVNNMINAKEQLGWGWSETNSTVEKYLHSDERQLEWRHWV